MWIILSLLLLQTSDSFASYNKGSKRCGAQSGSRGAGTAHSNGAETNTIKHPWAVAFMIEDQVGSGEKRIHCSGSIIDPTHIITAAHCFYPKNEAPIDKSRLTVVLGASDPIDSKDLKRGQTREIKNVEIHDQYDKQNPNAYNDIAIVELTKKIRFKSNIWPVCLPEETNSNQNHLYRQGISVIGYGPMSGSADDDRTSVTQLDLVVKKKRFCNQKYDVKSIDRNYLTIMDSLPNLFNDKSVFCASNQGQESGTCGGDSGGPVLQFDDDFEDGEIPKWVQVGAVHGSVANCDGSRFPSIFVRLDEPKILEWIFRLVFPDKLSSLQNTSRSGSRCIVTENSSNQKKPCVFPYKLQAGETEDLNTCTNASDPDGKYWCSTKTDRDGVHVKGHWGYCNDDLALFIRSSDEGEGDCPIPDKPSPKPPRSRPTTPKPVVDCKYSVWSRCSKTCGVGTQSRTIKVDAQNGGQACNAPLNKKCRLKKCPIDCKYSAWSRCSEACGDGTQSRTIEVDAQNGGQACNGALNKKCKLKNCPGNSGSKENGPVTKDDCKYTCLENKGCQSRSTRGGSGRSQGSCFPQSFGGRCTGIPEHCQNCNEVVDCEAGQLVPTDPTVSNGQVQCVTTCNSNGGCSVKIVNGPPGKSSGSCFPPDFKGRCSGIPDLCARGNHISTQCGSPCQAGTRNV